jgi:methylated-DNA-[protein]-cysteine S-methyltransferase
MQSLKLTRLETPVGLLTLVASDDGLRVVHFGHEPPPSEAVEGLHPLLSSAEDQLREYFAGERTAFELRLDLRGTPFQVQAWQALASIPYGTTVSYGEQARRLGRPSAVRAVGAANGRNPIAIVLPCHRVIGARGELTGYGGGLDVKQALLEHEARVIEAHPAARPGVPNR